MLLLDSSGIFTIAPSPFRMCNSLSSTLGPAYRFPPCTALNPGVGHRDRRSRQCRRQTDPEQRGVRRLFRRPPARVRGAGARLRTFGEALPARALTVLAATDTVSVPDKTIGIGKEIRDSAVVKVPYTFTFGVWEGEEGAVVVDSSRSRRRPMR